MLPPIHPICGLFPMLPQAELEGMAEDIRRRGKLLEPIVLLEGAVLDGRNRLEACQRAVLALEVLPLLEREAKERQRVHSSPERKVAQNCATLLPGGGDERGKAADHAARLLGVSPRWGRGSVWAAPRREAEIHRSSRGRGHCREKRGDLDP